MSEITLNGRAFRLQKLDPLTQLAIGIKVLPLAPALRPAFAAAADMRARVAAAEKAAAEGRQPDAPIADAELSDEAVTMLAAAAQKLGDEGRNYVIGACLRAVLMEIPGGGFLPAWSTRDEKPDASIDVV
ncbi:phage tail assembly chaperone, partial [Citrobacter sp. VF227]